MHYYNGSLGKFVSKTGLPSTEWERWLDWDRLRNNRNTEEAIVMDEPIEISDADFSENEYERKPMTHASLESWEREIQQKERPAYEDFRCLRTELCVLFTSETGYSETSTQNYDAWNSARAKCN